MESEGTCCYGFEKGQFRPSKMRIISNYGCEKNVDDSNLSISHYMESSLNILCEMITEDSLPTEQIVHHLQYLASIAQLSRSSPWQQVLKYDGTYRQMQYQLGFQWGTESDELTREISYEDELDLHGHEAEDDFRDKTDNETKMLDVGCDQSYSILSVGNLIKHEDCGDNVEGEVEDDENRDVASDMFEETEDFPDYEVDDDEDEEASSSEMDNVDKICVVGRLRIKHPVIKCTICGEIFSKETHLTNHMREYHEDYVEELKKKMLTAFRCEICSKKFKSKPSYLKHMYTHTNEKPYKCDICNREFLYNGPYQKHLKMHTLDKPYKCTICGKSYHKPSRLKTHMTSHSDVKPYKCHSCDKSYRTVGQLNFHVKTHTGIVKTHTCDVCHKTFRDVHQLKAHLYVHSEEKPHKCEICDKSFKSTPLLKSHQNKQHNENKNYKCESCDKSYVAPSQLEVHRRIHTGEKPYLCDICSKGFRCKMTLSSHLKSHSEDKPYKCSKCLSTFKRNQDLYNHNKNIHDKVKNIVCDVCGYRCNSKTNMKAHLRVHSGERPYGCRTCGKTFNQSQALRRHEKSMHG